MLLSDAQRVAALSAVVRPENGQQLQGWKTRHCQPRWLRTSLNRGCMEYELRKHSSDPLPLSLCQRIGRSLDFPALDWIVLG
jgi:hypothetical protein